MSLPISITTVASVLQFINDDLEFFKKYVKIRRKRHSLKCVTCGKFIQDHPDAYYAVIEGFREPYHIECRP